MSRGTVVCLMTAVALAAFALGRAGAEDGMDAEMAAWVELGKTGPEHAELMKKVGTWTVESKMWMQPGAEPLASKGKAVFTSILGGRFLRQEYEGEIGGEPFHGVGCTGFNNATKQYEDAWADSSMTGMMFTTGTATDPGKVVTFRGTCAGPGGKEMKMRTVMKKVSDDEVFMESFCDEGNGENKCWEATYRRSK